MHKKHSIPLFSICIPSFTDIANYALVTILIFYLISFIYTYFKDRKSLSKWYLFLLRPFLLLVTVFFLLTLLNPIALASVFGLALIAVVVGFHYLFFKQEKRSGYLQNLIVSIAVLLLSFFLAGKVPQVIGRSVDSVSPIGNLIDSTNEPLESNTDSVDDSPEIIVDTDPIGCSGAARY